MYNCAHLRSTKESLTGECGKKMCEGLFFQKVSDVLIVTLGRYWLIHDSTGSVKGDTSWFLVSIEWYWLKFDGALLYWVSRRRY